MTAFLIITGFAAIISDSDTLNSDANDEIPLSLEDFDQSITGKRETHKNYSSSPLGTYIDCSDYIYTENKKKAYDEETKVIVYDNAIITFSVSEVKYNKDDIEMIKEKLLNN